MEKGQDAAEKYNHKIIADDKNNLISYLKIGTVTFWVGYTKLNDSYIVQSSYCHRIQIVEGI